MQKVVIEYLDGTWGNWDSTEGEFIKDYSETTGQEAERPHTLKDLEEAQKFAADRLIKGCVYLSEEPEENSDNSYYQSERDSARERWSMFHNEYK